jgi:hypothetical protein
MQISQASQQVYGNFDVNKYTFIQEGSSPTQEPTGVQNAQSDTVQISEKAKTFVQKAQDDTTISEQDKILPVEAYSLPGWMGDFIPQHAIMDSELGQPYLESNSYLRDSLSSAEEDDLSEYMQNLFTFYKDESERRGIEGKEDYYNSIVLNQKPGLSEELRQAVYQRLIEDPRMMKLAQDFGVTI